jgi:hypothetical protein
MSPENKANELLTLFGTKKLALLSAEQVFSIRKGFKGKEYTKFVRFWVNVIVKLK